MEQSIDKQLATETANTNNLFSSTRSLGRTQKHVQVGGVSVHRCNKSLVKFRNYALSPKIMLPYEVFYFTSKRR